MKKKIVKIVSVALASAIALGTLAFGGWLFCTTPKNVELTVDEAQNEQYAFGDFSLAINKQSGTFSVKQNGKVFLADAVSEYKLDNKIVSSADYTDFRVQTSGEALSLQMKRNGLPTVVQTFTFPSGKPYFLTELTLSSAEKIRTDYIAPLVLENGGIANSGEKWSCFLEVPYDNDGWVQFETKTLNQSGKAYEVGTFFKPNGKGLVIGSVKHDLWKSAVEMRAKFGRVKELKVYCGATYSRMGNEPHGAISGETVSSAPILVGWYDSWQNGMNEFAEVNLQFQPKRKSVTSHVPIGWNSWGSVQSDLDFETAVGISDYVKENLQDVWQKNEEPVYINLDSYWDNLSDDELKAFAAHCKANNQKAGIYIAPFIMWGDEEWQKNTFVPGTNGTVRYYDLRLKKSDGTLYGKELDGCYPMDVTNPAARLHIQSIVNRFKAAGFEYIKLDFLVHASLEGEFYNSEIQTGIEAYNYAMGFLAEMLGEDMFINLAMSPTFPYAYANGRRFACDAYHSIDDTEYTLNSLTYGFWEQKLYDYTDPDHLVVWNKEGKATEAEAVARVTSGVICGTSFLSGDNFVSPAGDKSVAEERFLKTLANKDAIEIAKIGKAFTPVFGTAAPETAEIYMLEDGENIYIAMFNFTMHKKRLTAELPNGEHEAIEVWTGEEIYCENRLTASLDGRTARLFKLTK